MRNSIIYFCIFYICIIHTACSEKYEVINIEGLRESEEVVWLDSKGTVFVPENVALVFQSGASTIGVWREVDDGGIDSVVAADLQSLVPESIFTINGSTELGQLGDPGDKTQAIGLLNDISIIPMSIDVWVVVGGDKLVGCFGVIKENGVYKLGAEINQTATIDNNE